MANIHSLSSIWIVVLALLNSAAASTCSQELLFSGYPSCANTCFSICDKYCPSILTDDTCTCREANYIRETYTCLKKACSEADLKSISSTSESYCTAKGYDIHSYFTSTSSAAESSTATGTATGGATGTAKSSQTTSTAASASSGNSSGGKSGISVGVVVGIALGIFFGVVLAAAAVWFLLRRRKRQQQNATPHVTTTESAPTAEPVASAQKWDDEVKNPELHGTPIQYRAPHYSTTEVEGNTPGNAPGWKPLHELG